MGRTSRAGEIQASDTVRPGAEAVVLTRDVGVDALFRAHYAGLLRLAVCLVGDRARAEDAVQDAFISVYANWDRIRDHAADVSYVRSAVIYRCRSRLRERLRELTAPGDFESVGGLERSSEEHALVTERHERLAAAVRSLPRRQREVLVCRYYLELSVAETAAMLDISDGSVKRHSHRGIERLTAQMGGVS